MGVYLMTIDEVFLRLANCLTGCGFHIELDGNDIDLRDFIADSMTFLTVIIAIENEFNVELPVELLNFDNLSSMNAFASFIAELSQNHIQTNLENI